SYGKRDDHCERFSLEHPESFFLIYVIIGTYRKSFAESLVDLKPFTDKLRTDAYPWCSVITSA
ncbi:hypothetical protein TNCT_686021, partial [Trichonephila clavata]